ncbi:peptidoglycan recognition protein family protein [Streptomyces lomondensis]|uniref:peptidoglycan recognition protein family protein n=1 Tax=Streptomyces lomondensis TaxID=68229 RepID=UPI00167A0158|nr:peptidoglycan recognition protein [Streptomyces lomondensis]MCF0080948.1 peptidoglycan recognition protein [Streptomyces lomondensis]
MRGFLASSIGVTCAAALALPLTPPALAAPAKPVPTTEAATAARPAPHAGTPTTTVTDQRATEPYAPGSTQSLPLQPLTRDRATPTGPAEQGLPRRAVRHFSLVGVVWDDPGAELHGRVQVRTRAAGSGAWSGWQDVETHHADHAADPDTPESTSGRVRGATAPLWVGDSDGVELRVRAEPRSAEADPGQHRADTRDLSAAPPLPSGLRLELVDPGEGDAPPGTAADGPRTGGLTTETTAAAEASAVNANLAPLGATEIAALNRAETEREFFALNGGELAGQQPGQQQAGPYIGPRPRITTRRGWGADEGLRERGFRYTKKVRAAFVHHTASGNNYRCSQVPSLIRSIYRYHVESMGWRDIGYNFLIDKCGKIYEGRAGGVARPVLGAHTLGFNNNSMGIAVLGSYGATKPSKAAVRAVARLTAWKLGLYRMNPKGKTYLKSAGGNLYRKGKKVRLNVISGHRDGFKTECPGRKLYGKLGSARSKAARYQGR